MGNIVGIDLGTTFSAAAQLDETGRPVIVHNQEGSNITPSVVFFQSENNVEVGEAAKAELDLDPNVIARFKRDRFAAIRNAKLRLQNLKIEELTQQMRNKSKQIKH